MGKITTITNWDKWQSKKGRDVYLSSSRMPELNDLISSEVQQRANQIMDFIVEDPIFLRMTKVNRKNTLATIRPESLVLLVLAEERAEKHKNSDNSAISIWGHPGGGK